MINLHNLFLKLNESITFFIILYYKKKIIKK